MTTQRIDPTTPERAAHEPITDLDVAHLPRVVRRYLRFLGVPGRLPDRSFRMSWSGRFRTGPEAPWRTCDAWQYNTARPIARDFRMRLRLAGPLSVVAWDTYADGRGRMRGHVLGGIPVLDESGAELDLGELVTWLNDAVLLAPSMLLRPEVRWTARDDDAFDVVLSDAGRTVSARVVVDEQGAPREFSTTDRFVRDPDPPGHPWIRARWTTPIDGWTVVEGRRRPTAARAVWHLPRLSFAYAHADFATADLQHDVPPVD